MPTPALAVLRTIEQIVNQRFVRLRGTVFHKAMQFRPRRRETDQVQVHATQQHVWIGLGKRPKLVLLLFRENKRVNGIAHPAWVPDPRNVRPDRRTKRPMILQIRFRKFVLGRVSALRHPGGKQRNLFRRQRPAFRRHPPIVDRDGGSLDQRAFVRFVSDDRRPALASLANQNRGVQPQLRLLLERAVTGVTTRFQDRLNLLLVVDRLIGAQRRREK